tara:strand:- start:709 stop:954 length:246 start_codon:yes stop_codon:yes gene_type:complete
MSEVSDTKPQPQTPEPNDEQVSSFQPAPPEPNGQMDQGLQYTKDDLNVIMNLIHNCTIKGQDAPLIVQLGQKTATMLQSME